MVSQVSSHWDSSSSSPPTSNWGERGSRGRARRVKKVVVAQPAASPSSSPRHKGREQPRHARINAVNRIKKQFRQEEDNYGLHDQEVNCHSWTPPPPAPNVSYLPLKMSSPMCGNRLSAGRTLELNPWAPEYWPSSPDVRHWASSGQLLPQLPAVWASTTWLGESQFLGIGPLPLPGFGPTIPVFGPTHGGPANPAWLPVY